jgi:L-ornithine Nalpha-acyltransferase
MTVQPTASPGALADCCASASEGPGALGPRVDNPSVLGRIGTLEVRLARSAREIRAAQKLRFEVFHRELSAGADRISRLLRRDRDVWDAVCDHLLVVDSADGRERIVGTYRLYRSHAAVATGLPFYTQQEFDVESMMARHPGLQFMELGRSCVLAPWRNRRTIELLWHGIWTLVLRHRVDVMVGCASLHGADPATHCEALGVLALYPAPEEWQARAVPADAVSLSRFAGGPADQRRGLHALPPLVKGYLRLGARFGTEAVADNAFGTTDVLVVLPVPAISERYVSHYGTDASRHAVPA